MRINQRRHHVEIQRQEAGTDADGQPNGAWVQLRTAWASIKAQTGIESIRAAAETSVVKVSIGLRYCTDITAGMRVVHGGVTYDINAVLPDEESRRDTFLVCQVTDAAVV